LLHDRQQDYDTALRVIDRGIQLEDSPPYQTLKLRIQEEFELPTWRRRPKLSSF
jgi:hypothetical protein